MTTKWAVVVGSAAGAGVTHLIERGDFFYAVGSSVAGAVVGLVLATGIYFVGGLRGRKSP